MRTRRQTRANQQQTNQATQHGAQPTPLPPGDCTTSPSVLEHDHPPASGQHNDRTSADSSVQNHHALDNDLDDLDHNDSEHCPTPAVRRPRRIIGGRSDESDDSDADVAESEGSEKEAAVGPSDEPDVPERPAVRPGSKGRRRGEKARRKVTADEQMNVYTVEAFEVLDRGQKGRITAEDVAVAAHEYGLTLLDGEAEHMISFFDPDKEGALDIEMLKEVCEEALPIKVK